MARLEVITGRDRQRRWSDAEKLSILCEAFGPGAEVAAVARRHDIRVQQIYYWRKKFSVAQPAPVFLPVSVFDDAVPSVDNLKVASDMPSATVIVEILLRDGLGLKLLADLDRGLWRR